MITQSELQQFIEKREEVDRIRKSLIARYKGGEEQEDGQVKVVKKISSTVNWRKELVRVLTEQGLDADKVMYDLRRLAEGKVSFTITTNPNFVEKEEEEKKTG